MNRHEIEPLLNREWRQRISGWDYLSVCDSTNQRLLEKAASSSIDGHVVVADVQTSGRGRKQRPWQSEKDGSLLFSVGVEYDQNELSAERIGLFSIMTGIGLCEALHLLGLDVHVKWPNDVMLNNAKTAGILIESQLHANNKIKLVTGIGLNLSLSEQLSGNISQESAALFSSDFLHSPDKENERRKILGMVFNAIFPYIFRLPEVSIDELMQKWQFFDFFKPSQRLFIRYDNKPNADWLPMTYRGINRQGHILFSDEDNQMQTFHSADISIRKDWLRQR